MKIGIDVDGVIADNHTAWLNRYNRAHEDANFTPEDLTQWEFWNDLLPGCDWAHLKSFWTPDIYEEVQPFPGSVEAIRAMEAMGHEVVFITSCTRGWEEWLAKDEWLSKHGFGGHRTWAIGPEFRHKDKAHVAQENGIDWLVDDHIPHVEAWPGHAILMTRPHNKRLNCSRKRVKSLEEVVTILKYKDTAPVVVPMSEARPMVDADTVQAIESKVLDFAGKVDGGGVKGSQTDDSKLPMWLVPASFTKTVLDTVQGDYTPTVGQVITCLTDWVNDNDPFGLRNATQELADWQGPANTLRGVARVLQYGAKKYAANNWRRGMKWSDVASAALRHAVAIVDGEENDAESGLPHWAHLGCCLAFLLEYTEHPHLYAQFDDRFKRPVAAAA